MKLRDTHKGGYMETINEVIVVEGRDDEINLKQYFDCEVITTRGFGITEAIMKQIEVANERTGVIVLTDPDYAGEMIRKKIIKRIPDCKHAFIPKDEATKDSDIGVENASKESMRKALNKVRSFSQSNQTIFQKKDLYRFGLIGRQNASNKRAKLGEILGIGYCNGKQLIDRLNNYGITKEEFLEAMEALEKIYG